MKRIATTLAVLLGALLVLPVEASSASGDHADRAKPKSGIYACTLYNTATGQLETKYNVKIAPKGTYQYARFANGGKLVDPKSGIYSSTKKKIVFKTGPMKSRYGKLEKTGSTPTISVYTKKPDKDTYVDCYRQ